MTHHRTSAGRPFVACNERDCTTRSFGRRERFTLDPTRELDIFDLPRGWSVTPYPDDFDHGATRHSLIDGSELAPIARFVGLFGDLHTCSKHRRA